MKTSYLALVLSAILLAGCGGAPPSASTNSGPGSGTPPGSNPPSTSGPSQSIPANAVTLSNIQTSAGWNSWGQLAPAYQDCSAPCAGITWSMAQGVSNPSKSGNAMQFNLGGVIPYSDVLFSNPVIGQFSTQGLPDNDHTLLPTIHNFVYDADFYVTKAAVTQVLEFDVSMYMNGVSMIWGNQCNHLGGGDWDIWDNVNARWIDTGVHCSFIDNAWNHVTIQIQREPDNSLLFQSFTLNGVTTALNKTYPAATAPASWWGITVNYQMDGDAHQSANTTYMDNFTLSYW